MDDGGPGQALTRRELDRQSSETKSPSKSLLPYLVELHPPEHFGPQSFKEILNFRNRLIPQMPKSERRFLQDGERRRRADERLTEWKLEEPILLGVKGFWD